MLKRIFGSLFLLFALAGQAWAVPVTMNFTVTGFPISNGNAAPTDPVTGTIVWDAASATSDINSLTSVNLTLDGHSYLLSEVGFISPFGTGSSIIGGTVSGVAGVSTLTNDFWIRFNQSSGTPVDFVYASSLRTGIWSGNQFTQFSISDGSQVPAPASLALVLAGALGFATRRRQTA